MPTIDTSGYVSEFTKKTLEQFGWQQGDPLLENTGEIIQQIRDRTPVTKKAGLLIDIELMTEKDIELMRAVLAAAKNEKEKETEKKELNKKISALAPGVQEAYRKLEAATAGKKNDEQTEKENTVEVIDDREAAASNQVKKTDTHDEVKKEQQTEVNPIKKPDTSPEAGVIPLATNPDVSPPFCPRCDWDMRRDYDVKITDTDKENFLATILGGTRFKKNYSVLNGKYVVVFRTLLAEENKQIHRQLVLEQKSNEFFSDTEWFIKFFEYRLACSIESVAVNDKITAIVPTLDEIDSQPLPTKFDDPSLPKLVRLHSYVVRELLSAEITRRLVSKQFREFQREYEALEAMALEPNFW